MHNSFFYMFISILYIYRAASFSSWGETILSIQHLVYVTLCRRQPGMQVGKFLSDLHTRLSPTQSDTYQMLYWYSWFSWWWARGCSKHVENWNKHVVKDLCVKLVIYKKNVTKGAVRWTECDQRRGTMDRTQPKTTHLWNEKSKDQHPTI
jgi:hypothetical protein